MAKKSTTKAPAASKETKAAAPEPTAPKAEASTTDSPASADGAAPAGDPTSVDTGTPAKKPSGSSRPISYFSSVSTDEYRSGWANIFDKPEEESKRKASAKRASKLPVTFELNIDDLNSAAREHLDAFVRLQAKKKQLNFDKLAETNDVTWEISCHISE
jgi:hypothetical protein